MHYLQQPSRLWKSCRVRLANLRRCQNQDSKEACCLNGDFYTILQSTGITNTLCLFDIAMVYMAHRNRWFYLLKMVIFHGELLSNQMVSIFWDGMGCCIGPCNFCCWNLGVHSSGLGITGQMPAERLKESYIFKWFQRMVQHSQNNYVIWMHFCLHTTCNIRSKPEVPRSARLPRNPELMVVFIAFFTIASLVNGTQEIAGHKWHKCWDLRHKDITDISWNSSRCQGCRWDEVLFLVSWGNYDFKWAKFRWTILSWSQFYIRDMLKHLGSFFVNVSPNSVQCPSLCGSLKQQPNVWRCISSPWLYVIAL